MVTADSGLEALGEICVQFAAFCQNGGAVSEADTRAKVVDAVLTDVLGWPENAIQREEHVNSGFIDYQLRLHGRPFLTVEAKREGQAFTLPAGAQKHLKLSGALLTDRDVAAAVLQVRSYCSDIGSRYALATNGHCWIVFRANREDMPWREGSARVFRGLGEIAANFTDFWNLLSYTAVAGGSLDAEFGSSARAERELHRVVDTLFNADLPLQRNSLHAQLFPLIRAVFEDIADQDQLDILKSCYVHTGSLRIVAEDLDCVITDAVPRFLKMQGAVNVAQGPDHAGQFEGALIQAVNEPAGQLFLILGGIGCGKSTFLKRYQRLLGKQLLDDKTLHFHIDLIAPPLDPRELTVFVWRNILHQLRSRYASHPYLESRRNLRRAFHAEIEALRQTALRPHLDSPAAFEAALSPYLERWQAETVTYVPRLLHYAQMHYSRSIAVFIDNVDQLAPSYQAQVFLLAQSIARTVGAITVVSLREESYYSAQVQRTFTAYNNRKFHIASPRFPRLIGSRITYALRWLDAAAQPALPFAPAGGLPLDRPAIKDFLRIVEHSIFVQNRNIARFIDALCFGNMRAALQMFTTFLCSGATDADKMLRIYRREGAYYVAFHEFVKSIMLEDRHYYKEAQSPILNVFDCGAEKNSSHFTALRLLRYLLAFRGQGAPEGQGYCDLGRTVLAFEDVFDNREDLIRTLNKLLTKSLIESDTRGTESIAGAAVVRATSAGWYYTRHLVKSFAYLDLVLQDTPLNAAETEQFLRDSVRQVDNLTGREEDKLARMEVRFGRVQRFLAYLLEEEVAERRRYGLDAVTGVLGQSVAPWLQEEFASEREWISRRLRENRERYAEEAVTGSIEDRPPEPADDTMDEEGGEPETTGELV